MDIDTIAAISTAPGEAGIGIIRLSGNDAIDIASKIFKGKRVEKLEDAEERKLTYGHIIDPLNNSKVDEVLIVYMRGPYTYTREDIVEINCHGGIISSKKILEIVLENGARMAEPGEFTKRAFLNGRLDLSQAEAVMDLIGAKTDKGFNVSLNQLEGRLSTEVNQLRDILLNMLAHIEAAIDFPEDEVDELQYQDFINKTKCILDRIDKLITTADTGKILREGLKTVILGKPNVGKSSLMNAILRENRAIVTDIPGTTRDIIEEYVNINGIPLKIIDTAGIRETSDLVEKIGVEKAKDSVDKAELVIAVFDASTEISKDDLNIIQIIKDKNTIVLFNKTDLPNKFKVNDLERLLPGKKIIKSSIVKGIGLDTLEEVIEDMFLIGKVKINEDVIVANVRHKNQLVKAKRNIEDALRSLNMMMPIDCIEVDLKNCWSNLGEITGDTVAENIIDKIFENFCIGK